MNMKNNEINFKDLLTLYSVKYIDLLKKSSTYKLQAYEILLRQESLKNIPPRPYLLKDLTFAYNLLFLFNYLEEIKYVKYTVNCKSLLHKYLYSGYKITDCFLNNSNADFKLFTKLNFDKPIRYDIEQFYFDDQKNLLSYPTSIRKQFEAYIKSSSINNPIYNFKISTSQPNKNENKHQHQPRYYMPIYQIPEFLFSFLYFDGRKFPSNFETHSNSRIPKLCSQNQHSEFSYKLVMEQITDFFKNTSNLNAAESIYHNYQLDKLFLLHNLETLNRYYELYISNLFLDIMINIFQLSYIEITELKNTIITEIWNDTNFLVKGHNSSFIDYMLPFDIYFQYNLFFIGNLFKLNGIRGLEGLKQVIRKCKEDTQQVWNSPYLHYIPITAISTEGNFLDIKKTQNNIKLLLKENSFYKNYYFDNDKLCQNIMSFDSLNKPFSFEILKYLLPQ